jgi:hypothetical protein
VIGKYNLELRAQAYDGIEKLTKLHNFTIIGAPGRSGELVSPILTFELPAPWTSVSIAASFISPLSFIIPQSLTPTANE